MNKYPGPLIWYPWYPLLISLGSKDMEGYLIITFSLTCSTPQYLEEACMPDASAMRCHFRPRYYGLPSQRKKNFSIKGLEGKKAVV
jgi:hypothetical protein